MKKTIIGLTALAMLISAVPALAGPGSVFGTQSTAVAAGKGLGFFGVGLGLADLTSFVGTFDYGLSKFTTGRLKLGFADEGSNSDMDLSLGAEIQWQVWQANTASKKPLDLAVGGMIEYWSFESNINTVTTSLSAVQFGGFVLGSYSFVMSSGQLITPYGRLNVRLVESELKSSVAFNRSDSDLELGITTGVAYQLTNTINLYGEVQVDGNDGFFIGADFRVM